MSLLAWYPFSKDGNNKGLTGENFSVDTSLFQDGGKIGKFLYVNNKEYSVNVPGMSESKQISVAFWFKELKETVSNWNDFVSLKAYYNDGTKIVNGEDVRLETYTKSGTDGLIGATWYSSTFNTNYPTQTGALGIGGYTIDYNKWHHMVLLVDFEAHKWTCIKDGTDKKSSTINPNAKYFLDTISIGDGAMTCGINDLRVYNHLLSQKEINEIYKTKVLHYTLVENIKKDNLLKNSRTFSSTNWTGSGVRNENAFLNTFYSMSYTNINGDTTTYKDIAQQPGIIGKLGATYTLTCWVKGSGQFIAYFYGPSGYIQCAKAETSQGTTFTSGDGHAKINLSNVWQKIWIKWTLKDTGDETITKNLLYRLYGGNNLEIAMPKLILDDDEFTPWSPHPTDSEYTELGYNSVDLYDESGITDSGKKIDVSIDGYFNGTTSTINKIPNPLKTADEFTIATWAYFEGSNTYTLCTARTGTGIGLAAFLIGGKLRLDDGNLQTVFTSNIPINEWIHVAMTRNSTSKSLYLNGELKQTINQVGDLSAMGNNMSIGASCYSHDGIGSANFTKGYYNDFRLYATALDAAAIKQLYEAKAQIDDCGNAYTKLFVEDENAKLKVNKDAEIVTKDISERLKTYDMKIDFLEDGSQWARIFYHNNKAKTVLFTSVEECRNIQTEDKYSRLAWLDNFRGSDGKFEFMLKYPNNSTGYNRWKQSNNPCNEYWPHTDNVYETVEGYEPISISWTASNWGGLCRQSEDPQSLGSCYLSGSVGHSNWFYAIGARNTHYDGIPTWNGSTDSVVELWVRIDNTFIERKNICPTESSYWESGHYLVETGEKGDQGARIRLIDLLPVESGLAYYFNTFSNSHQFVLREMNVNKVLVKSLGAIGNGSSITLQPTTRYLAVTVIDHVQWDNAVSSAILDAIDSYTVKPFICLSSETDKTYEEYNKDRQTVLTTAKFGDKYININKINEI